MTGPGRVRAWVEARWPVAALLRAGLDEPVRGGASFAYALGSATLFVFVLQVVTGIAQLFYYVPTVDHAYDSLSWLRDRVAFGWLVHGLHYWGANAMIVLVLLHLSRVFLWGAYKRPRELVWLSGVGLLLVTMGLSFTGAPLPWDERGYWAARVGTSIAGTVPLVGARVKELLMGGTSMGQLALSRFFVLHTAILPLTLAGVIGIHLVAFRTSGNAGPWGASRRTAPFWPDQVFRDLLVGALVFAVLVALSVLSPPPTSGPADPTNIHYVPKPEWNFLFLYEMLKFLPGRLEPLGTVGVPTLLVLLLASLPFVDRRAERRPWRRPLATTLLVIGAVGFVGLTVVGMRGGGAATRTAHAAPSAALSASAREGRRLFQSLGCHGCHAVRGTGGSVGPDLSEEIAKGRSRAWIEQQIRSPRSHFPHSVMPPFDSLDDAQMGALVDYVLSLAPRAG